MALNGYELEIEHAARRAAQISKLRCFLQFSVYGNRCIWNRADEAWGGGDLSFCQESEGAEWVQIGSVLLVQTY